MPAPYGLQSRCLFLVSRFSVALPLRQAWLQAGQVLFQSLRFGDLRAMACCGRSVPFWSLRSSLSLRSGMRLWAVATAKRNSKARAMPTLYAVARTCHFAAFLSPFPPLHTAPCPPGPTALRRCVPYTPPPAFRTRAASATLCLVQRPNELLSAHFSILGTPCTYRDPSSFDDAYMKKPYENCLLLS